MDNDYWKRYLEQRKRAEEAHAPKEEVDEARPSRPELVEEPAIEEVRHEEVIEETKDKIVDSDGPVEGQVRHNGLQIFRNGEWVKRF